MSELASGPHPDALPGAEPPRVVRVAANDTTLHAELRGSGPAVLLIPAGGEDAEWWRGVAERLVGCTVVTYDRRGTRHSAREDWPGKGSAQHADDAAALLVELGLNDVVAFGNSSAGIIAMQLAIRHPHLVRRALVFEPGYLRQVPGGEELHRRMREAAAEHLAEDPDDWPGAAAAVGRALVPAPPSGPAPGGRTDAGLFNAPEGREWFMLRGAANAEPLQRDDVPILSYELADEAQLAASPADIRFVYGTESPPIFRQIAMRLASVRGQSPDVIEGVSHMIHFWPDKAAAYILRAAA